MTVGAEGDEEGGLFGGRIPIVIGVTGHRVLGERVSAIARTIAGECRKLRSRYPHSPFLVLSGLAEGADRLVAEIAMRELDAKLCAVLPFPPEDYVKDFAGDGSREAFHALLAKAVRRVDVHEGGTPGEWSAPGAGRDRQYARQGGLIAEQAQIMFAVWDGHRPRGLGGTGDVVEWFMQGYPPKAYSAFPDEITPLDPSEPGLLIQINPATAKAAHIAPPRTERQSDICQILKRIERFNKEARRYKNWATRVKPLLPPGREPAGAPREAVAVYRAFDALAVHYRDRVFNADVVIYTLGLLAVFFFGMINDWPVAPLAYFVVAGAIAFCMLYLKSASLDPRAIEYRGVAEAARVLFFWRLAGIKRSIWLSYLADCGGAIHWVRHAVRTLEFCEGGSKRGVAGPEALELVKEFWVEAQIEYYRDASERHWRHYKRWKLVSGIAFGLSFAVASLLSVAAYYSLLQRTPGDAAGLFEWSSVQAPLFSLALNDVTDKLQVVLGLLAAAGVAARAFVGRRADLELTKQYDSTRAIFERALRNLGDVKSTGAEAGWPPDKVLETLGREALLEHAEWLWTRHARPFEMLN